MPLPSPAPNSTALVTGASAGIGVQLARCLASRGQGLVLVARRKKRLESLALELSDAHGVRVEAVGCDLGKPAGRGRLAARIEELGLDVGILVNNAGFGTYGDFVSSEGERQVEMVRLNCEAVIDLTARFVPGMIGRREGAVLNVASTAAFQPLPGNATYAATKALVLFFTEALHEELRGTGVTATALCPGPVKTEFAEAAGIGGAEERLPDPFWTSAEEVAEAGIRGLERDKRVVVPGHFNQAGAVVGRLSPRALALPLVSRAFRRVT